MIPLREMADDFYIFDDEKMEVFGKRNKKRYKMGDKVTIEVLKINLEKRHLDFKMISGK